MLWFWWREQNKPHESSNKETVKFTSRGCCTGFPNFPLCQFVAGIHRGKFILRRETTLCASVCLGNIYLLSMSPISMSGMWNASRWNPNFWRMAPSDITILGFNHYGLVGCAILRNCCCCSTFDSQNDSRYLPNPEITSLWQNLLQKFLGFWAGGANVFFVAFFVDFGKFVFILCVCVCFSLTIFRFLVKKKLSTPKSAKRMSKNYSTLVAGGGVCPL